MSIKIHQLEHVYNPNTPFSHAALKGINLEIPEGKVTAIIGQTGSGKSTLVQHLNGLLIPTAGTLDICGYHIQPLLKIKDVKQLRKEVGLVFQFPEYQLFEETIEKDIAFGPKNFGVEETEASQLVSASARTEQRFCQEGCQCGHHGRVPRPDPSAAPRQQTRRRAQPRQGRHPHPAGRSR